MHLKSVPDQASAQNAGSHKIKSAISKIKRGVKMLPPTQLLTAHPGFTCAVVDKFLLLCAASFTVA